MAMKRGKISALSNESIKQIVGGQLNAEDIKPPPELAQLRKEVRAKQNEVRSLRKRWWQDHKDLDLLSEKVKHHQHHEELYESEKEDHSESKRKSGATEL